MSNYKPDTRSHFSRHNFTSTRLQNFKLSAISSSSADLDDHEAKLTFADPGYLERVRVTYSCTVQFQNCLAWFHVISNFLDNFACPLKKSAVCCCAPAVFCHPLEMEGQRKRSKVDEPGEMEGQRKKSRVDYEVHLRT